MKENEGPIIFKDRKKIPKGAKIFDVYDQGVKELFFIQNPKTKRSSPGFDAKYKQFITRSRIPHIWIYYPWIDTAVRSVSEPHYFKLRCARNRNIISEAEQTKFRQTKVGIAGLSVGSAVVRSLVTTGGSKILKLADPDKIEISNLNRINASLTDVGLSKTLVAARTVWETDPFAKLFLWGEGIRKDTVEKFILGKPKIDVLVDEMDDLSIKILVRKICKSHKIPVIMATDNGDGIVLEVERFDLEPHLEIFHGALGNVDNLKIDKHDLVEWLKLAVKIVELQNISIKLYDSILEIGKSITGIPQIGTGAALAGSAVAYAVRQIANNFPLKSGKYLITFENQFLSKKDSAIYWKEKQKKMKKLTNILEGKK